MPALGTGGKSRVLVRFRLVIDNNVLTYYLHSGTSLSDLLKEAVMMSQRQQKNHNEFTATFPSNATLKWQKMVEVWNANRKAPNPYMEPVASK